MVIMMKSDVKLAQIEAVTAEVTKTGRKFTVLPKAGPDGKRPKADAIMVFVYGPDDLTPRRFMKFEGVKEAHNIEFKAP
jgi:hypothetical protein